MSHHLLTLTLPNRNTQAHWVCVFGAVDVFYSYTTPVAFSGPNGCFRRKNDWGPTTGRHFKESVPDHYEIIGDEVEFNAKLTEAIIIAVSRNDDVLRRLAPKIAESVTKKLVPELEAA